MKAKLENGTVKITNYYDGIAEGIRLTLTDKDGNESEIALDILKDTGEARAIIYKYDIAMQVPDCWTDFDEHRKDYKEMLSSRFNENLADKILKIIDYNWSDFTEETAIVITVEGTKCLTWITDEFTPIECAEKVFPFDEKQIYPIQMAEMKICFKRW